MPGRPSPHSHGRGGHGHDQGAALAGGPSALRVLAIASSGLAVVAALELGTAFTTGSAAVLADGLHNLGDVFTTVALGAAFLLSRRAATRRFPYGYHRGEDIAGLLVLLLIIASAVTSGVTSIEHLIHRPALTHPGVALAVALAGFAGNELVAEYKLRAGRRLHSVALAADGKHSRIDGLASLGAAAGVAGAWLGMPALDPLAGLLITAVIGWVAAETGRSVTGRLLDEADASLVEMIAMVAAETPGVAAVPEARARWTGRRILAEVTLEIAPSEPLYRAHALGEEVRHRLHHRIEPLAEVLIHLDPAGDENAHRETAHHTG